MPALVRLAKACGAPGHRPRQETLETLVARNPGDQIILLIDGRIAGAAYTQPVPENPNFSQDRRPRSRTIRLLGFHLIPSLDCLGYGDLLLEWTLFICGLRPGFSKAIASAHKPIKPLGFMPFGPNLYTCLRHGAHIIGTAPPSLNGTDSKYSLRVGYDLPHCPVWGQPGIKNDSTDSETDLEPSGPEKKIRAAVSLVQESRNRIGTWNSNTSFHDMGMDALDLAGLRIILSTRLKTPLSPTFFYRYSSPAAVMDYFTQKPCPPGPSLGISAKANACSTGPGSLPEDMVAVVGMACKFPGAPDLDSYWKLLSRGRDAVSEIPSDRWGSKTFQDGELKGTSSHAVANGGFLDHITDFDAAFFNISPREARQLDPQHRLLLEINRDALESAGIAPHSLKDRQAGCYVGIFNNDYQSLLMRRHQWTDYDLYFATGNSQSTAAGRLAYILGCQGPALSINTACSSSLVAVHTACLSLSQNECNLALASGVNLILSPEIGLCFARGGMLSPDGICQTFDAKANGYVRSEGAGALVLMRLGDALRDGHHVHAVIPGSAVNQDGASNGLTAPNGTAQADLIRETLNRAGLSAGSIDYLETHGTGTPLGDAIEYEALQTIFRDTRPKNRPLIIGSVKTNIGHTESAAGIAGLIKVILAMGHGTIPAHLHFNKPGPLIDLSTIPAAIPQSAMEWPKPGPKKPRSAGVSSFGFSGTNAHVIVQEPPNQWQKIQEAPKHQPTGPGVNILTLSAATPKALDEMVCSYANFLEKKPETNHRPVCYTSQVGRTHFQNRLSLVCRDSRDLTKKLDLARLSRTGPGIFRNNRSSTSLAYLFTGQGAQYPGMAKDLYRTDPGFSQTLDQCHEILENILERPLLSLLFDPDSPDDLDQTINTQPTLFALEYALAKRFISFGVVPDIMMGHSVGEYVAACLAGIFSLEDGLRLISARAALMQALPRGGAMAAVLAPIQMVETSLEQFDTLDIAAYNGPSNTVISGPQKDLDRFIENLAHQSVKAIPLKVSHAFHSSLMTPMLNQFEKIAKTITYSRPSLKLISNCLPGINPEAMSTPEYWVNHVRQPVGFSRCIRTLVENRVDTFLEIGPKPILTQMAQACAPDKKKKKFISTLNPERTDLESLDHALAALYSEGIDLNWEAIRAHSPSLRMALPTYPYQRSRFWFDAGISPAPSAAENQGLAILGTLWDKKQDKQVYASVIGTGKTAFLNQYHMGNLQVLPAAAYLTLALEASQVLWSTSQTLVTGLVITRPLVLGSSEGCRLQTLLSPLNADTCQCSVFTMAETTESSPWQEHCRMTLTKSGATEAGPENLDTAAFKSELSITGSAPPPIATGFAPEMNGLASFTCRNGVGLGRASLADPSQKTKDFLFHPVLLDACIKIALNTLAATLESSWAMGQVLMGIDQFELYCLPSETLWCKAAYTGGPEAPEADVMIYGTSGKAVARIKGIVFRRPKLSEPDKNTSIPARIYTLSWLPSALNGSGSCAAMPRPESIKNSVIRDTESKATPQSQAEGLAHLESMSREYARQALASLGWNPVKGTGKVTPNQMEDLGIHKNHHRLMERLLNILESEKTFPQGQGSHVQEPTGTLPNAELSLLQRCGPHLAEVLKGDRDPISLIFPDGDLDLTTDLYETSDAFGPANQMMGTCVSKIVRALPHDRELKILEIGAGTGGTTGHVLKGIGSHPVRYTFTDVTPMFLRKAEKKFASHPCMEYRLLDIETHPLNQGFDRETYDLVIAANVLHATPDLGTTLEHIKALTAPGGSLMLVEGTAPRAWIDLIFGLTRGWWKFTDHHRRPAYPLISQEQWKALLREKGFTDTADITPIPPEEALFPQSVILGRRLGKKPKQDLEIKTPKWQILGDSGSTLGQSLARELGRKNCTIVPAGTYPNRQKGKPADVQSHPGFTRVIFLPTPGNSLQELPMGPEELTEHMAHNCGGLLHLVQAIAADLPKGFEGLWVITSGAGPSANPLHAPLMAMTDTIRHEHPELNCRVIDLDPGAVPDRIASLATLLKNPTAPPKAALKDGTLLLPRLKEVKIGLPCQARSIPKGPVLITGGLGGLGMETAGLMVRKGYEHLILLGRTSPSPETKARIKTLEAQGTRIQIMNCDVSDPGAMEAVFHRIDHMGQPLSGIIHAAGVFEDHLLMDHNWSSFERVFAAKVKGSWILHDLTRKRKLDFFILFSSAMTLLPHPGLGNYVAANSFMDALAVFRQQMGLPGLSIAWGPYGDKGMAGALSDNEKVRWKSMGLAPMAGNEALDLLERLMDSGRSIAQAAVMSIDWPVLAGGIGEASMYQDLITCRTTDHKEKGTQSTTATLDCQLKERPVEARKILEAWLKSQLAGILGFDNPENVDESKGFFKQGMDSLTALELRGRLQSALGTQLPATLLFKYPTIQNLSRHLAEKILSQAEPPDNQKESDKPKNLVPAPPVPKVDSDDEAVDPSLSTAIDEELNELEKLLS